jgi:hypothetical protein
MSQLSHGATFEWHNFRCDIFLLPDGQSGLPLPKKPSSPVCCQRTRAFASCYHLGSSIPCGIDLIMDVCRMCFRMRSSIAGAVRAIPHGKCCTRGPSIRALYGQSRMASAVYAVPHSGYCTGNPAWQVLYTRSRIAGTVQRSIPQPHYPLAL